MAFSTQVIKYGWMALASLGVLAGTTIYVANNQRHQVKPEDIIQPVLGTVERCLALQYSTNPVSYYVNPPSFVRTWYSNVYTTNGVTVYTNIVTNTIGWHIDRDMMVSLDTTIKALVPYYCDTNTVYDGTTNIVTLTVTGLWASLQIGDGTNKFTREPAWTNTPSTNWYVCYTSYWPTNGTYFPTTNNYTSDVNQVINYGKSWTATGGVVWASMSNWANSVVSITNPATYDDYPWRIYKEDLEERYKVLNALKYTAGRQPSATVLQYRIKRGWNSGTWSDTNGWASAKATAVSNFNAAGVSTNSATWNYRQNGIGNRAILGMARISTNYPDWVFYYADVTAGDMQNSNVFYPPYTNSGGLTGNNVGFVFVSGSINASINGAIPNTNTWDVNDSGLINPDEWLLQENNSIATDGSQISTVHWFGSLTLPTWGGVPNTPPYAGDAFSYSTSYKVNGWERTWSPGQSYNFLKTAYTEWNFQYCTNKYW